MGSQMGSLNCSEAIGAISAAASDDSSPLIVFYQWREHFHSRAAVSAYGRAFPFRLGFLFAPAPLAFALARAAGVSSWSFCDVSLRLLQRRRALEAAPGVSAALVPP